jgi:dTDP-4-amino-4,6-dideoxygalactose transaminase
VPDHGGWYYEARGDGTNYRLTDIQAALGLSQLRKLERFLERRAALAARYREALGGSSVRLPPEAGGGWRHAYHLFCVRVDERRRAYEELRRRGIGVQVHYVPLYRHPVLGLRAVEAEFPRTEEAYSRLLSLPLFPDLADEEQDQVISALTAVAA